MKHKKTMRNVLAGASIALAACALMGVIKLDGIRLELRKSNEIKSKELDLKIIQLDLACRKHTLDSARFEAYQREH